MGGEKGNCGDWDPAELCGFLLAEAPWSLGCNEAVAGGESHSYQTSVVNIV